MTATVMDTVFHRFGVVENNPKGDKFDPNMHEAIYTFADATKENNTVGDVMMKGWKIGDRCLRAAKVGIIKK
jgi:molecular chaperone GrpE